MKKIKLKLKKLQWHIMADALRTITEQAPVKGWELETYILAELYLKKKAFFDIYPHTTEGVKLSLTMIQAIAVNNYLGAYSQAYNNLIRMQVEPKLIMG